MKDIFDQIDRINEYSDRHEVLELKRRLSVINTESPEGKLIAEKIRRNPHL